MEMVLQNECFQIVSIPFNISFVNKIVGEKVTKTLGTEPLQTPARKLTGYSQLENYGMKSGYNVIQIDQNLKCIKPHTYLLGSKQHQSTT
jgi:hypothetical protein